MVTPAPTPRHARTHVPTPARTRALTHTPWEKKLRVEKSIHQELVDQLLHVTTESSP